MATAYRAVEVSAPGQLTLVERALVEPGPGQVRIQVEAAGVCHTDSVTVEGTWPGITLPRVVVTENSVRAGNAKILSACRHSLPEKLIEGPFSSDQTAL